MISDMVDKLKKSMIRNDALKKSNIININTKAS